MKNIPITKNTFLGLTFAFVAMLATIISIVSFGPMFAGATAPAGLNAQVSTSTQVTVGPQANTAMPFGTLGAGESRWQCAARVISTGQQAIMISFASISSTTLSTTNGFWQPASTTVAYDGGIYGCDYMTIRGLTASSSINVMETH